MQNLSKIDFNNQHHLIGVNLLELFGMARYFVFILFALSSAFCQAQAFVLTYSDHCKHQNFSLLLHNDRVILPDVSQQLLPNDSFVSYSTDLLIIDAQSFASTRKAIQPQDTNVQYAIEWIVPCPDGYLGFGASINSISNDRDFLMVQFDTGFTISSEIRFSFERIPRSIWKTLKCFLTVESLPLSRQG